MDRYYTWSLGDVCNSSMLIIWTDSSKAHYVDMNRYYKWSLGDGCNSSVLILWTASSKAHFGNMNRYYKWSLSDGCNSSLLILWTDSSKAHFGRNRYGQLLHMILRWCGQILHVDYEVMYITALRWFYEQSVSKALFDGNLYHRSDCLVLLWFSLPKIV